MRITKIALKTHNPYREVFDLNFRDHESVSPYIVKAITGLDGDEITPRFYPESISSTGAFYDMTLQPRTLVMRIALNPDFSAGESYSSLRDSVYKAIASQRTGKVYLTLYDGDDIMGYLDGFITKFEAPHFSKVPEIQVTIRCDDPYIRGHGVDAPVDFATGEMFIDDQVSTAPHGFVMRAVVAITTDTFNIRDANNYNHLFRVHHPVNFNFGEVIVISSVAGDRYIHLEDGPIVYNIAEMIYPGSIWPTVFPGMNEFTITPVGMFAITNITYKQTFWGV